MDTGPFMSYTIGKLGSPDAGKPYGTKDGLVLKGISVKLGKDASVVFDTDLMRYAAGWTGGFLDFADANAGQDKGNNPPEAVSICASATRPSPASALTARSKTTARALTRYAVSCSGLNTLANY